MFDTPELTPLCIAPFVGLIFGLVLYIISQIIAIRIGKKTGKIPNWLISNLPPIIVVLSIAACFASVALEIGTMDPAPWFTPTERNVVGAWILTPETIRFLEEDNRDIPVQPHELIFKNDGTFHITNIPTFWGLFDAKNKKWHAKYMSGSGIWHLGQVEGSRRLEWVVFAQFQEIDGQEVDTANQDWLVRFYFEGHLPPYILRSLDGDLGFDFHKK